MWSLAMAVMELDIIGGTINGWMNEMKRNGMRKMTEWMCDIGIMAWYAGYLRIYSLFTAECSGAVEMASENA